MEALKNRAKVSLKEKLNGRKIRVVEFGRGPIRCSMARLASTKPDFDIVGAIDLVNVGRDLGEVAGLDKKLGVVISSDAEAILYQTKPDIVLHATSSSLKEIYPQLEMVIKAKLLYCQGGKVIYPEA